MRVYFTKRARKPYKCNACSGTINPGTGYYSWQHMHAPVERQCLACGYPKPSRLASSDKVARYCKVQENVEEAMGKVSTLASVDTIESLVQDLSSVLTEGVDELRALAEEYEEAASNMEQAFPNGSSVIDEVREKGETCNTWADNMEQAVSDLDIVDFDDIECDQCSGTGKVDCDQCNNQGEYTCGNCNGSGKQLDGETDCEECAGKGTVPCDDCGGDGEIDCEECNGEGNKLQELIDEVQGYIDDAMSETL